MAESGGNRMEQADGRRVVAEDLPEGFTLSLALVDALPVALFSLSAVTLGQRLGSPVFVAGAVVAFLGGAGKVLWKLLIALARRNVGILNRQMRIVMPLGLVLMVVGALMRMQAILPVLRGLVRLPSLAFLILWIVCMCLMGYFAGHREQDRARDNWIEQGVNAIGQASLLVALLLGA